MKRFVFFTVLASVVAFFVYSYKEFLKTQKMQDNNSLSSLTDYVDDDEEVPVGI